MANILVIDDMAGVRRAVCSVLKKAGHTITEADNGAAGLQLAAEQSFDLIMTDIVMPGIDGTEVIMALSSRPGCPPIIAMSGGGAHLTTEEALTLAKQTADGALAKPFSGKELMAVVDELLAAKMAQ
jgi:two-component system, chemotaxis family, chemotaxis protein CheY